MAGATLLAIMTAAPASAADIKLVVRGVQSTDGPVLAALHRETADSSVPGEKSVIAGKAAPATVEDVRIVFEGLPPGRYAVAAFHDANADGELNANFVGMPTECFGFSNDARGFMGPPDFEAAAILVEEAEGAMEAVLTLDCPGSAP